MCAAASWTLRFSSTMTRTLSTPVAGAAEGEPACDEPKVGAGTGPGSAPVQAATPSRRTVSARAAARPRHRAQTLAALPTVGNMHSVSGGSSAEPPGSTQPSAPTRGSSHAEARAGGAVTRAVTPTAPSQQRPAAQWSTRGPWCDSGLYAEVLYTKALSCSDHSDVSGYRLRKHFSAARCSVHRAAPYQPCARPPSTPRLSSAVRLPM
jgi:hypothetical protein